MHKITYLVLRNSYFIALAFLVLAIISLLNLGSGVTAVGHTLILVREMCATGAVVLIIALLGSAVLHEKLS